MNKPGVVGWFDLTVENADEIRSFYEQVVGWESSGTDMGEYQDFCMIPKDAKDPVGGICHKRGANSEIPSQWLMYVNVENLAESIKKCEALGGKIKCGPRDMGSFGTLCVIEDPAGAFMAIIEPK